MAHLKLLAEYLAGLQPLSNEEKALLLKEQCSIEAKAEEVRYMSQKSLTITSPKEYGMKMLGKRKRNKKK